MPLSMYRTCAIITRGLYTFYPLFEVHLCSMTFGFMYGQYSRAVSNQEPVIVARVRYVRFYCPNIYTVIPGHQMPLELQQAYRLLTRNYWAN